MFGRIKKIFSKKTGAGRSVDSKQYGMAITNTEAQAVWPQKDYENFAKETYLKNLVSFRCIDLIAKSVSSVGWSVYKKTADGKRIEVVKHPIKSLLRRANPRASWSSLNYDAVAFLLIAGNTYLTKVSPTGGPNSGVPKEMYCLRPDKVTIKKDPITKQVVKYVYKADSGSEEQVYEVDPKTGNCDLLHIKFFHPINDYYGASIVEPAAREIDTNNAAVEWHKKLLDNQARPGLMLIYERMLGDEQYKRVKKDLENNVGPEAAGKTLIFDDIKDAKPYGFNPTEMDFIEGNRDKARMIATAFGVPAQLLNIKGDQTFANFEQARQVFWEDTVIYYLKQFKAEFNYWLFEEDEEMFLDFDIDNIPALNGKRAEIWARVQKADFLTDNEKREAVGCEEIPAGKVLWKPAAMLPIDAASDPTVLPESDIDDSDAQDNAKLALLIDEGYTEEEAKDMIGLNGN